jgi:hypothetical protein
MGENESMPWERDKDRRGATVDSDVAVSLHLFPVPVLAPLSSFLPEIYRASRRTGTS